MDSTIVHKVDVAIIGAGWYGLVTARTYLRLRPNANILIIDSDNSVGGVWSKDRLYPNLVAQVRLGLFNYSDTPMSPHNGDPEDPRVTGEMIHNYLQKYAEDHDLLRRIRFNTFVEIAIRLDNGKWQLRMRDTMEIVEMEKLIVATGVTSIPYMPSLVDDQNDGSVPVIHSRDLGASFSLLRDSDEIEEVVVVGAAKSAYDAVYLLLTMGKKVKWLIRDEGAGPLAILPFKVLGTFNVIAVASTRLMSFLSPSILNCQGFLHKVIHKSALGKWCVGRFWDCLDYVSGKHAGYDQGDHVQMLKPEIDRQSVFWAHSGLGVVTLPDFWPTLHSPNLTIVRDQIRFIEKGTVHMRSPNAGPLHADFVVMCTGWADHFAMFDSAHKELIGLPPYEPRRDILACKDHGPEPNEQRMARIDSQIDWAVHEASAEKIVDERLPFLADAPTVRHNELLDPHRQKKWRLYRRAIPVNLAEQGDRSLAILGQIHTVQTPLVAEVQSFWAILYLLGEIDVPSANEMAEEVALWNAWTRKRYLNQGQKFPYSLYDFLPYIDCIFRDLGLKSRRKTNPVSELFSPYCPSDFNGFVDEYLENEYNKKIYGSRAN